MTTKQTIAPPTPPNVKINSSTPKKFSRKIGHIFPKISRISFKIPPRPKSATTATTTTTATTATTATINRP